MKRILQAVAAALMVGTPHAAPAFEVDTALDRFPSRSERAVGSGREWRDSSAGRAGSIHERSYEPRHALRDGWDRRGHHRPSRSVIDIQPLGGAVQPGTFYGTAGTASPSFVVVGLPDVAGGIASITDGGLRGGAKILDVEADRLDRKPYGKDGLAVAHVGTAKIIRIAPDFRRGREREREEVAPVATAPVPTPFAELSPAEQAVTVYPDPDTIERPIDPPAPRVAEAAPEPATSPVAPTEPAAPAAAPYLEPWTPDWLRDCVARYPDFDASLGTYTNAEGQRRFCTGAP